MRFMAFYTPERGMDGPPDHEHMAAMSTLIEETRKSGHLLFTGALLPAAQGFRIRLSNGRFSTENGAGPGANAQGAGFALLQAATKEEQRALIENFLKVAGDGECAIVPAMDEPPQ
ncbi:MAG: hypothetical protein J0H10_07490 [Alphaproteobacteria bacterium]|nr:hypothetical protein [Alphaproteobacteria bacterium]